MIVTLDKTDIKMAEGVAEQRNSSQRSAGRQDGLVKGSSLGRDVEGAMAELAVAKALNLPWDGKFLPIPIWDEWKHNGNDVGSLEIRSTTRSDGRLILHPSDKDWSPYLLVTNENPTFKLVGWIYGSEGKSKQYWRNNVPRPCYMVPQSQLRSMESLASIIDTTNKEFADKEFADENVNK